MSSELLTRPQPSMGGACPAASDAQRVAALLDFSGEALCVFDFQSLTLVFCNNPAARLIQGRQGTTQPGALSMYDLTALWLGSYSERVVDDMLARFQHGHPYIWEPRAACGSAVCSFSAQYYKGGSLDGILVKAKGLDSDAAAPGLSPRPEPSTALRPALVELAAPSSSHAVATPSMLRTRRKSFLSKVSATPNVWSVLADPTVHAMLERSADLGGWDAFDFDHVTLHNPLTAYTLWALRASGLMRHFNLPEDKVVAFLATLEHRYSDNPYHNRVHAADVTRSVHYMLSAGMHKYLDPEQRLALYIGAAGHDAEHGGLSNTYLCATNDPIAVTYHNTSPLENVHAAVLVRLMLQPSLNFLSHLAPDVLKNVRKYAVSAILHTDPVSHRSHMDAWAGHVPKWQRTVASVQSTVPVGTDLSTDEIHSVLGMVLKCADVGHMAQPFEQHRHWVAQLTEEFYQQGDREKALGMAPLPFMDRAKAQCVPSSQVGFMSFYALPMFDAMAEMFPEMKAMTTAVRSNFDCWSQMPKTAAT